MADKPRKPGRPQGEGPGPARRARQGARTDSGRSSGGARFSGGGGGFTSVDEQLRMSLERGTLRRRPARRRTGPGSGVGMPNLSRPEKKAGRDEPRLSPAEMEVAERLQKVMARAGVASRRHSEELIQAGRVTVNGRVVTELGTKVVAGRDIIEVDGRPLGQSEAKVYVMLNKPKGYVTTLFDPQGRPKVTDLLEGQVAERVYPVGRLDYDTEGLLLLTNDGDLANGLMHPARRVKKTYIAKVRGVPGPAKLKKLEEGVELEDGPTAPAAVKVLDVRAPNSATVSLRIHEGRNRQVRRMFAAIGHEVIHLKRTTMGPLNLGDLPIGQWRNLTDEEVAALYRAAGLRLGGKPRTQRTARRRS